MTAPSEAVGVLTVRDMEGQLVDIPVEMGELASAGVDGWRIGRGRILVEAARLERADGRLMMPLAEGRQAYSVELQGPCL